MIRGVREYLFTRAKASGAPAAREPARGAQPCGETEEALPVFFVVGMGKSGTTWLMRLLNSHPEVLCRGESRFFDREWHRPDLEEAEATIPPRSLYGALYNSRDLRLWIQRSSWGEGDVDEHLDNLTRMAIDYFLKRRFAGQGIRIVGDKTPFISGVNLVEEISRIYPEAKVVHVIRDGRDVAVSWMHHRWNRSRDQGGSQRLQPEEVERRETYYNDPQKLREIGMFEDENLRYRARSWRDRVEETMHSGPRLFGGNYTEVRYEDLLENTAGTAERLFEFLGVSTRDDIVSRCVEKASFESLSGGRQRGEENPAAFFRKGVAGDWRNVFTGEERRIYIEEAGDLLERLDYEP